jgi:hypothetical protein
MIAMKIQVRDSDRTPRSLQFLTNSDFEPSKYLCLQREATLNRRLLNKPHRASDSRKPLFLNNLELSIVGLAPH